MALRSLFVAVAGFYITAALLVALKLRNTKDFFSISEELMWTFKIWLLSMTVYFIYLLCVLVRPFHFNPMVNPESSLLSIRMRRKAGLSTSVPLGSSCVRCTHPGCEGATLKLGLFIKVHPLAA
jgi:hypothetical protein